jgi:hypothetical protein
MVVPTLVAQGVVNSAGSEAGCDGFSKIRKRGQAQHPFRQFAPMRFAVAIVSPPDHHDISGGGFREVAEALHHALLALGHDSVQTNRLDLDERHTIVLGGNLLVQYALEPPKNPLFYNREQLGDDLPWMTMPEFVDLFTRYPTWDYSQANIDYLAGRGLPRPSYVPIGYVPELTRITPAPEDIDVLFYGALNRPPIRHSQRTARPRSSGQMATRHLRREPRCPDRTLEDRPQHPLLGRQNLRNHPCLLSARQ